VTPLFINTNKRHLGYAARRILEQGVPIASGAEVFETCSKHYLAAGVECQRRSESSSHRYLYTLLLSTLLKELTAVKAVDGRPSATNFLSSLRAKAA
jgi:hypothetical protein